MNSTKKLVYRNSHVCLLANRRGGALIISMIFVLIFSALAVSMAAMSGTNVQLSDNQHNINSALSAAQSGLEIMRHYLSGMSISGEAAPADKLTTIAANINSNLYAYYDDTDPNNPIVNIPSVILNSQSNQTFSATISYGADSNTLQIDILGNNNWFNRHIRANFNFATIGSSVFDFGIATKGSLHMSGNIDIEGLNEDIGASVYIESENDSNALIMSGKSAISGSVNIINPNANVDISSSSSIGGESGDDALDHVYFNASSSEFPVPCPANFEHYIENTFDPNDPNTDTTDNLTLTNVRILAGTNPHFSGSITIKGIMFIESPNIVKFSGSTDITGIIIANGDLDYPSSENLLEFRGNITSHNISELPEEGFSDLKQETGTFLLAPGFSASFGGSFETLNGVIAASGIEFFGNAGGTINGSVINYADTPMTLSGNTNLIFNSSGTEENPTGFMPMPSRVLEFLPRSYSEIPL